MVKSWKFQFKMSLHSDAHPRRSSRLRRVKDCKLGEKLLSEATDQQGHDDSTKMYTVRRVEVATVQVTAVQESFRTTFDMHIQKGLLRWSCGGTSWEPVSKMSSFCKEKAAQVQCPLGSPDTARLCTTYEPCRHSAHYCFAIRTAVALICSRFH